MAAGLSLQTRRAVLEQMVSVYRDAPRAQKRVLLDEFTQTTGYHRTYARWLLNHSEDVLQTVVRHPRQPRYGPEVVDALVQAWNANNRKCTKCLIPFLPTLFDSLERHGYLHLTEESKKQLLSLSPATADRLLRASRIPHLHGISTTRAGTLLKQQIPIETQQELNEVAQALDPIRLLEQLQRLQQALFHCATEANPFVSPGAVLPLRVFAVETCTTGGVPARESIPDLSGGLPTLYQQQEKRKRVLGWRRTQKDPFEGAWEQIASWVQTNPERSSGDIFRELQRLSPGRYQPLQIRTLQRGMRKIRAFLLETAPELWPEDVIQGQVSDPVEPAQWTHEGGEEACSLCSRTLTASPLAHTQENTSEHPFLAQSKTKKTSPQATMAHPGDQLVIVPDGEQPQAHPASSFSRSRKKPYKRRGSQPIERAIQDYLEDQERHQRRTKTLEWHQTALGLLRDYVLMECHMTLLHQITHKEIRGWLAFLEHQPTTRGNLRAAGTIASYARSARAFFQWAVRHTCLESTPFAHLPLLKANPPLLQPLEPEEWESLLLACRPPGETNLLAERAMARNQAILWVRAETGMPIWEIGELRVSDVDQEGGILTVRGKGSKRRQVPLGQMGRKALLSYLDQRRPGTRKDANQTETCEDPLFLSEAGHPLTANGIALLFGRLRKRAGITRKGVDPARSLA